MSRRNTLLAGCVRKAHSRARESQGRKGRYQERRGNVTDNLLADRIQEWFVERCRCEQ